MEMLSKKLVELAIGEVSNIPNLEDKASYLGEKLDLLYSIKMDVLKQLEKEESDIRGRKRKREVEDWLNVVVEKTTECEKLIEDVRNCRFYSRGDLATQVIHKVQEVTELVEQSRCFQGLVLDTIEPKKVPLVTSRAQGRAFEHNLGKIMACVMDDSKTSIGIHGMGGVGKTTLALQVHDNLLRESKFRGCVYWITVSHGFTIYRLQKDIANAAGIDLSNEQDEKKRAGTLQFYLKKKLNFAFILDDVWKGFDAEEIGVPLEGRKLLVTSREGQVSREMGCNDVIEVEVLSEREAWELFQEKLKLSPTSHLRLGPEATQIAREVAKECAGLPLGIITIAASMRGVTDIHEWRYALEELKESFTKHENMKDKVLPILMYSYDRLRDPILQSCFLHCSLYPEDNEIRKCDLVSNFVYEEIMDKKSSRRLEFNQGYAMLRKLESACLLVGCKNFEGDECIKMHDLIRDVALWVTRDKETRFMVKAGLRLREVPSVDKWANDLNRVSLMHNQILNIPNGISPRCSSLSSLYLNRNPLNSVADSFFVHMKSLQTLNLSYTKIVTLPDSVSLLVTLKALLLRDCKKLVSLPSLENLKALNELDLYNTTIEEVIHGLESLSNLKRLEFQHHQGLNTPPLALHGLTSLQRLILSEDKLVKVEEGKSLRHLEELQGRFASIDEFRKFIISMNSQHQLRFCHVLLGESKYNLFNSIRYSAIGKLDIIVMISDEYKGETAIHDEMMLLSRDIGYIEIVMAKEMKCLLRISRQDVEVKNRSPLESLKELRLLKLPELKNIIEWEGAENTIIIPPAATFWSLTRLEVQGCHGMKKLLPLCLVNNLRNLEVLEVGGCYEMEEIIGEDNEAEENNMGITATTTTTNHVITLPKLKKLELGGLRELKSISKSTIICNSIQEIRIHGCTKLKKIPLSFPFLNRKQSPPSTLKRVEIEIGPPEIEWWHSLQWTDSATSLFFNPF